ncbi:MAG: bifunctional UDP-N-acetylglucosamine diphosphorylase/glucosamine-1-phosphate N-acetyltransferase GlmU [Clostridia bacterium]
MKLIGAIILSAGDGGRMKSARPLVLHEVCGAAMCDWVLRAVKDEIDCPPTMVIGGGAEEVMAHFGSAANYIVQDVRLGTGNALLCSMRLFENKKGYVIVVAGNMPLLEQKTVRSLVSSIGTASAGILTANANEPYDFLRVIRDDDGRVMRVIEPDGTDEGLGYSNEITSNAYCFDVQKLLPILNTLNGANPTFSVSDCINEMYKAGEMIESVHACATDCISINDRIRLADCYRIMKRRLSMQHMQNGVTVIDPDAAYIGADVKIGMDCIIYPDVVLDGITEIGEGTVIYSGCRLKDTKVGKNCYLQSVVANDAVIGDNVPIGPFVNLRPKSVIGDGVKIGDFVEVKNSNVGRGTKLPHLSYIGDSDIGEKVNIGCGTVFVNYDGIKKSRSTVKDDVFIGCNANIVAPVTINERAFIAAGSTITDDVPPDALAIARERQTNKPNYIRKR